MKASVIALHWLPRIICILGILFISKYAINSIESYLTLWQQMLIFLVHMIPCVLLLALLVIAWKWEMAGGILFTLIGLVLTPVIFQDSYNMNQSVATSIGTVTMYTIPLVLVGNLFIASYLKRRKYRLQVRALREIRERNLQRYRMLKLSDMQNIRYFPEIRKENAEVLQPVEEM